MQSLPSNASEPSIGAAPALDVRNFSFRYSDESDAVLRNVDLRVAPGEFVLLQGPSGCGKSSLALAISGLLFTGAAGDAQGAVRIGDLDPMVDEVSTICRTVGIVFQDPETQICTLTVEDEIEFGIGNLGVPEAELDRRIRESLDLLGIPHLRDRTVYQLSGGEKQKVAIASILAMRPTVLILDEPTSNLDPISTLEVLDAIRALHRRRDVTLILIEHKVDDVIEDVDRVVLMNQGRIITDGSPAEVYGKSGDHLLDGVGVWVPQVTEIALRLRPNALRASPVPITLADAERAFSPLSFHRLEAVSAHDEDAATSTLVEVEGLNFGYPDTSGSALAGVSLRIDAGDFYALLGPNGAGKSTLAKHLIGLLRPPPGTVSLGGADVSRMTVFELTDRVGYVFQYPEHQFVAGTIYDEVAYSLRARGVVEEEVQRRVLQVLEVVGLERFEKRHPQTLSMGQKRRLSVATMLVLDQTLLILDEPTFGLDYAACESLLGHLDELNRGGRTILMITHDIRLACEWARTAGVMESGRLTYSGPIAELFRDRQLLERAGIRPPPVNLLARALAREGAQVNPETINVRQFLSAAES